MPTSLLWLALGAFVIGTEGYMIAGLLPVIARDLRIPVTVAGQLITVFAAAYAIGTPILAAMIGTFNRKRLLISALAAFSAANFVAAAAESFSYLALARVFLALSAGAFLPTANAVAASLVPIEKRGRALAMVTGGGTVAVALGAPAGTWIASLGNWRTPFLLTGFLAALAFCGLVWGMPKALPLGLARQGGRFQALRRPGVCPALANSVLWAAGGFSFYSYIAPFLVETLSFGATAMALMLAITGIGAAAGTALGGYATDRYGQHPVLITGAISLVMILAGISLAAHVYAPIIPGLVALWACAGWAFGPAQQARLMRLAPEGASLVLSLHASAVYSGIALGSALGALTIERFGIAAIGYTSSFCQLIGLVLMLPLAVARRPLSRAIAQRPSLAGQS